VTSAQAVLTAQNISTVHSIIVYCIINPDSAAEQCQVMAISTSGMTLTGMIMYMDLYNGIIFV